MNNSETIRQSVIAFQRWMYSNFSLPASCEIFGKQLGEHLFAIFLDCDRDAGRFLTEIDTSLQQSLCDAIADDIQS